MCNGIPSVTSTQTFYYKFQCAININDWKVIIFAYETTLLNAYREMKECLFFQIA